MKTKPEPKTLHRGEKISLVGPREQYFGQIGVIRDFYYLPGAKSKGFYDYGILVELTGEPTESLSGKKLKLRRADFEPLTSPVFQDKDQWARETTWKRDQIARSKFLSGNKKAIRETTSKLNQDPNWSSILKAARKEWDEDAYGTYRPKLKSKIDEELADKPKLFREKVLINLLSQSK